MLAKLLLLQDLALAQEWLEEHKTSTLRPKQLRA